MSRQPAILVACDTFKGTLASFKVGEAFLQGSREYRSSLPVYHAPMSDGGAGLLDSVTYRGGSERGGAGGGRLTLEKVRVPVSVPITGPRGSNLHGTDPPAEVYFACDVAHRVIMIEMAMASGLPLLEVEQRDIRETTSYGTGELIRYAAQYVWDQQDRVHSNENKNNGLVLFLGIGGSGTNEGGLGALQALGLDIYVDAETGEGVTRLETPFKGKDLSRLRRVEMTPPMKVFCYPPSGSTDEPEGPFLQSVFLICDVMNPLVGEHGATFTFGPQKCSPLMKKDPSLGEAGTPPPPPSSVDTVNSTQQLDDLNEAVGVIDSAAFRAFLTSMDASMAQAATRVASSIGEPLYPTSTPEAVAEALLHAPQGGGAGGMSGFFHTVLRSRYLNGTEAVATLQNIRYSDTLFEFLFPSKGSGDSGTSSVTSYLSQPLALLVTGEGSYDQQTLSSHKTVESLLEMTIEANLKGFKEWYTTVDPSDKGDLVSHYAADRPIPAVLILCGKCGFESEATAASETVEFLLHSLLEGQQAEEPFTPGRPPLQQLVEWFLGLKTTYSSRDLLSLLFPSIEVLSLRPHYPLEDCLLKPYACVVDRVQRYYRESNGKKQKHNL